MGVNHMLDWTPMERMSLLGGRPPSPRKSPSCGIWEPEKDAPALPAELDLRDSGLVGRPRDQGTCGSCWAFSVIGMIEGQIAKKTGKLTRMSEQQLVDCTWSKGNKACDGGDSAEAMEWVLEYNKGEFPTAETYGTYMSENGFCHFDRSKGVAGLEKVAAAPPNAKMDIAVGAVAKSCWHVAGPEKGGVSAATMRLSHALVSIGPISVYVAASDTDFYYYIGGLYDNPACKTDLPDLDHLVLLTGYGTDKGEGYWRVRNSWSDNWGEGGYIRIAQKGNPCGIATQPVFALLA